MSRESRKDAIPTPRVFTRQHVQAVAWTYMRLWHRLEISGREHLPPHGPALVLANHASYLDAPAWLAMDPYPDTTMLALASLFRTPVVRQVLMAWDAIPVERRGTNTASIRRLLRALQEGRVVAASVESRRSRDGRLGQVDPVLAAIAARADVPIVPVGIVGTFAAMPRGRIFPRRRKVAVCIGQPFTLPPGTSRDQAARQIRDAIGALLPPEQRPVSDPAIRKSPSA